MKLTRPLLRWHGGKWLLAPWILQVLSGYPNGVYDRILTGWTRVERKALADGARAHRGAVDQPAGESRARRARGDVRP